VITVTNNAIKDQWYKCTFDTVDDSIEYHLMKHDDGRTVEEFTRDAMDFFNQNRKSGITVILKHGTMGIEIQIGTGANKVGGIGLLMENLLHFGTEKSKIVEELEKFKRVEFPRVPIEDELSELYSELVMIDSHIIGLVSKYIKDIPFDIKQLCVDDTYISLLSGVDNPSDSVREIVDYKRKIDTLVQMVLNCERQRMLR